MLARVSQGQVLWFEVIALLSLLTPCSCVEALVEGAPSQGSPAAASSDGTATPGAPLGSEGSAGSPDVTDGTGDPESAGSSSSVDRSGPTTTGEADPDAASGETTAADPLEGDLATEGDPTAGDASGDAPPPDAERLEPAIAGCADGERDGYTDVTRYPAIAACSGAWTVAGVKDTAVSCGRLAGDLALDPLGNGCGIEDLCAEGWHVCFGEGDVANSSGDGPSACDAASDSNSLVFFATRQSGLADGSCDDEMTSADDVFGCGTLGAQDVEAGCSPLNRRLDDDVCADTAPWSCGNATQEANVLTKSASESGGVICCRN